MENSIQKPKLYSAQNELADSEPPILSLIIPAYNENAIILQNVDEIAAWMSSKLSHISFEIIVVDDGSTDGMNQLLYDAKLARPWLVIATHSRNMGRGMGVRTGFLTSKGEYLICLDADLSYSPHHIEKLLEPLLKDEAEITLASPYHKDGIVKNVPHQRAILSKIGNKILGLGFNKQFSTVTCVARGFKRKVIDGLELVNKGKELHLEIIQKASLLDYRIKEIPSELVWRNKKRHASQKKTMPEIAIFKMRKTVVSHLVFNYISNPGILLFIPICILLCIISVGSAMIASTLFSNLTHASHGDTFFHILRQTLLNGQLSLIIVLFSIITLMIFIIFYFLSAQNKRYFEDTYILMMRMNTRIKHLEEKGEF